MTEERVGLLCNISSMLSQSNETFKLLRSYYLMRCNEMTKGYGLPRQHFSTKIRCPHCCLEWSRDTEVKVKPMKVSKRLKQKIKSQSKRNLTKKRNDKMKALLQCNEMEQVCTFCKKVTSTKLIKPGKEYINEGFPNKHISRNFIQEKAEGNTITLKKGETKKKKLTKTKQNPNLLNKSSALNVYSNALDVFSLKNEKNTLHSTVKEPPKVIKNCKKKKDKFAGLCQKAVLASAKLKQENDVNPEDQKVQNKLNLFLKPSSG